MARRGFGVVTVLLWAASAPAASFAAPRRFAAIIHAERAPLRRVTPQHFFGACIDGHEAGDTARIFRPANIVRMRSAGFGCLSYRLRTELASEAWHWNPRGEWSDPVHSQGYFVGSADTGRPIATSFGYRLPRRGNTRDQAGGCGYSRLDDGDLGTFWKTNPYLDTRFTHEDASLHPQWAALDFGQPVQIDAVTIAWGEPHATRYRVQYWRYASPEDTDDSDCGEWVTFPMGTVQQGRGGTVTLRLAARPLRTRFLRILLEASEYSGPPARDVRDRVGFAIREIRAGVLLSSGKLRDVVRHHPSARLQTPAFVSSTDPWCRSTDRNPNSEQPGLDLVARSGVTWGRMLLVPVSVLYGNPEDAAAEVAYLVKRGYAIRGVELGEEPDHQYASPEDYGALYVQFARAIHSAVPWVPVGGPSLETVTCEVRKWPSPDDAPSWIAGFMAYLRRRGCLAELQFFSFEWYPFDTVGKREEACLRSEAGLLGRTWARLKAWGIPAGIPWYVTEYGYSAFACRPEVDVAGALFTAQTMECLLRLGASGAYFFGLEPNTLIEEGIDGGRGKSWGNNLLFIDDGAIRGSQPVAAYWVCRLVTKVWAAPGYGEMGVYHVDVAERAGRRLLRRRRPAPGPPIYVCALRGMKGEWRLMLVNLEKRRSAAVSLYVLTRGRRRRVPLCGPWEAYGYGRAQYAWRSCGARSRPVRNQPPFHWTMGGCRITVPGHSVVMLIQRTAGMEGSGRMLLKNSPLRRNSHAACIYPSLSHTRVESNSDRGRPRYPASG